MIYEEKVTMRGEHYYEAYTLGKMLGKGGFATCFEIRDSREGKRNAVKVISKYTKNAKNVKEDNVAKVTASRDRSRKRLHSSRHSTIRASSSISITFTIGRTTSSSSSCATAGYFMSDLVLQRHLKEEEDLD